jgi:hypothetical protein
LEFQGLALVGVLVLHPVGQHPEAGLPAQVLASLLWQAVGVHLAVYLRLSEMGQWVFVAYPGAWKDQRLYGQLSHG